MSLTIDMRDPAFRLDPHRLLHQVRDEPGLPRDVLGVWLACHHADCSAGLRLARLSREPWRSPLYGQLRPFVADSRLESVIEQWMLFNDPPKHTRLRRLVNGAFKPPVVEALRDRVMAITDQLLADLPPGAGFDVMATLAQPLPVRVICDVLGLPAGDFLRTKSWSDALALVVEPIVRRETRQLSNRAAEDMSAYLLSHVRDHRRAQRRDTLLGMLVAAQDDDGALSDEELLGNLVLLFVAGHETTTNLIGNGLFTLLSHPDQLQRLRAHPDLMASAIEEMLRYEGPVNMLSRIPTEPVTLRDEVVRPGETIFFMIGAANRDPAVFDAPDRFDIGRSPNPHLAFGAGIHYCVGAPLARLEAEVVFGRLLQRHPDLVLVDPRPNWRSLINLRGLEALPVKPRG